MRKLRGRLMVAGFCGMVGMTGAAFGVQSYTLQILGNYSGAEGTFYMGINDAGQMIGRTLFEGPILNGSPSSVPGPVFRTEPYSSVRVGLDEILLPADARYGPPTAEAMNNLGAVVGLYSEGIYVTASGGSRQGVYAAPLQNGLLGINDSGQIVAVYTVYTPDGAGGYVARGIDPSGAYLAQGKVINNAGQVAGDRVRGGSFRTGPEMPLNGVTDLFSFGQASDVVGINSGGSVIGIGDQQDPATGSYVLHSFLFDGSLHDLGTALFPRGINDAGEIVGTFSSASDFPHGCLYEDGTMYDLNDLTSGLGGWEIMDGNAINSAGVILADARFAGDPLGFTSVLLIPTSGVPEPATLGVVGAGLVMLAVGRRRGRRGRGSAV